MTKKHILDIGITAVKHSGRTSMFDKSSVQYWAYEFGLVDLVAWIEEVNDSNYMALLESQDESIQIEMDLDPLLHMPRLSDKVSVIQEYIKSDFGPVVKGRSFEKLKKIPYTVLEYVESEMGIFDFLRSKNLQDHPLDYLFVAESSYMIAQFADDRFYWLNRSYTKVINPLDKIIWDEIAKGKEALGNGDAKKFNIIEDEVRFAFLM